MLIGLDFDNTIVCYDALFHRLASERGLLAEPVPATKGHVRDYLRRIDRESDWTELQGVAYGPRIVEAQPFPGVMDFLNRCHRIGMQCVIISHKTRTPYLGPAYDLHAAAHAFLHTRGFEAPRTGLSPDAVFLELTKQSKLARIGALRCNYFVDDLPEFLAESAFPQNVRKVLFDPTNVVDDSGCWLSARSWLDVRRLILGREGTSPCAA